MKQTDALLTIFNLALGVYGVVGDRHHEYVRGSSINGEEKSGIARDLQICSCTIIAERPTEIDAPNPISTVVCVREDGVTPCPPDVGDQDPGFEFNCMSADLAEGGSSQASFGSTSSDSPVQNVDYTFTGSLLGQVALCFTVSAPLFEFPSEAPTFENITRHSITSPSGVTVVLPIPEPPLNVGCALQSSTPGLDAGFVVLLLNCPQGYTVQIENGDAIDVADVTGGIGTTTPTLPIDDQTVTALPPTTTAQPPVTPVMNCPVGNGRALALEATIVLSDGSSIGTTFVDNGDGVVTALFLIDTPDFFSIDNFNNTATIISGEPVSASVPYVQEPEDMFDCGGFFTVFANFTDGRSGTEFLVEFA